MSAVGGCSLSPVNCHRRAVLTPRPLGRTTCLPQAHHVRHVQTMFDASTAGRFKSSAVYTHVHTYTDDNNATLSPSIALLIHHNDLVACRRMAPPEDWRQVSLVRKRRKGLVALRACGHSRSGQVRLGLRLSYCDLHNNRPKTAETSAIRVS
jgi:hypothetical protein